MLNWSASMALLTSSYLTCMTKGYILIYHDNPRALSALCWLVDFLQVRTVQGASAIRTVSSLVKP